MPYTRDQLEALPRSKLQAICKGAGFKANESTSKIIENILTYEADNAAHRLRSLNPTPAAESSTRRVTRGSDIAKQDPTPDTKSTRRASTRLSSNSTKAPATISQPRKSKSTQSSLGVGRPKAVGGLGARVSTRNATASNKSRKNSKKGKQRAIEEDAIEEEEEEKPEQRLPPPHPDQAENSGVVMVSGMPPTPAATPNVATSSHDTQEEETSSVLPSSLDFAPFHKLQSDMSELSAHYKIIRDQIKQVDTLQQELCSLRAAVDKQAPVQNELELLRKELQSQSSVRTEVSVLKQEVATLREAIRQTSNAHTFLNLPALRPDSNPLLQTDDQQQLPGPTTQVLGKRGRDSPAISFSVSANPFTSDGHGAGDQPQGQPLGAGSISGLPSPKKKLRLDDEDTVTENNAPEQSPFRLSSREETDLDKLQSNELDFSSIFNFNDVQSPPGSTTGSGNVPASEGMLGVPPPGFTADFLTHPIQPLPFSLTAGTPTNPIENGQPRLRRNDHSTPRKVTGGRLNPYKRTANTPLARLRTPSTGIDNFGLFGSNDLLSTKMQGSANHPESSVGVNPAQLLAQDLFDVNKTPAAARTLYGTELDGDTRFGEYGIDGLTKGFWKAPGFQF